MNSRSSRLRKKIEYIKRYSSGHFVSKLFLVSFLMICFSLLNANCVKSAIIGSAPNLRLLQINELEFKPINLPSDTNLALKYWVKSGDPVSIEWENFLLVTRQEGSKFLCSIENSPNEGCKKQNLCSEGSEVGVEEFEVGLTVDTDFLRIGFGDFVLSLTDAVKERTACKNVNRARPMFSATKSGLYRLSIDPFTLTHFPDKTMGETEIYVVGSSESPQQTVSYKLRKERIDSIDFWRWEIPAAVYWSNNFSKNIRVQDVRILNNDREVKPSRLILLRGYNGTVHNHPEFHDSSCFNDPNRSQTKKIDLTKCRKQYSSNSQIENKKVTPTYLHDHTSDKLYWFAEFDPNQGGDDVATISELKIEFILEAVN